MTKYIWCYVNKEDAQLFDAAYVRTPNLYCHNININVTCKKAINNIMHTHENIWTTTKNDIELCHNTNYGEHKISVKWQRIELNEDFADFLIKLVNKAHEIAKKIKQEGIYGEKNFDEIKSTIYSLVNKWSYNSKITIKEMAIELLYSFATRHKFHNGNKRTALVTCVLFLQFCGLFLRHTNTDEPTYMQHWEPIIINIISQKHNNKKENDIINYINATIDKNLTISYTRHY